MSLYLRYGSYAHASGECEVLINRQSLLNSAGFQIGVRETWTIRGLLQAATQALLSTAIVNLKAAYSLHGQNVGLYFAADNSLTEHSLNGITRLGGVRVVSGPSFPIGGGAEYTTFRTYEIVLEGEYEVIEDTVLSFNEVLSFTGGGRRYVYLQPLNGLPQKQQVSESTPFRATQQGSAVRLGSYPTPPAPIWPTDEDIDQRRITYSSPKRREQGGQVVHRNFEVQWAYQFTAILPMEARPNYWLTT